MSVDRLEAVLVLSCLEPITAPTPPPIPLATSAVASTSAKVRTPRFLAGAATGAVPTGRRRELRRGKVPYGLVPYDGAP